MRAPLQEEKNWDTSLILPPTRITNEEERRLILSLCVQQGLLTALDTHMWKDWPLALTSAELLAD